MRFTLILISLIIIIPIALLGQKKKINPVDTVTYKCGTLSNIEYDGVYFKAAKANIYYNAISKILFSGRRINGYSGYGPADRSSFACEPLFFWPYSVTKMPSIDHIIVKGMKYTDANVSKSMLYKSPFLKERVCALTCVYWCNPISPISTDMKDYFYSFGTSVAIEPLIKKIGDNHFKIGFPQALIPGIDYALSIGEEMFVFRIQNPNVKMKYMHTIIAIMIFGCYAHGQSDIMKIDDEEFMINIWKSDDVLKISVDDKQDLAMNGKECNCMSEREDSYEYCMIEVDRDNNRSMTIMDAQYIIGVTNGKPHAFFLYNYPEGRFGWRSTPDILKPHLGYVFTFPWTDLVNNDTEFINLKIKIRRQLSITKGDAKMFTYPIADSPSDSRWYKIKVPASQVKKTNKYEPISTSGTGIKNPEYFGVYTEVKGNYYRIPPSTMYKGVAYYYERKSFSRHHVNLPVDVGKTSSKTSFMAVDSLHRKFYEVDRNQVTFLLNGSADQINVAGLYVFAAPLVTNNNTAIYGINPGAGTTYTQPEGYRVLPGPLEMVQPSGGKTLSTSSIKVQYPPLKAGWYGLNFGGKWYIVHAI